MLSRSIATCFAAVVFAVTLGVAPSATSDAAVLPSTLRTQDSDRIGRPISEAAVPDPPVERAVPDVRMAGERLQDIPRENLRAPMPASIRMGAWAYQVPEAQHIIFASAIASSPGQVRELARALERLTVIKVSNQTRCGGEFSCATGTVTTTGPEVSEAFELDFYAGQYDSSVRARFLIMHEVGHLVDYDRISDAEMAAFERLFRSSPLWQPCFRHLDSCLAMDEIFAEQFALHATGGTRSMTTYEVPRLASGVDFQVLLGEAAMTA